MLGKPGYVGQDVDYFGGLAGAVTDIVIHAVGETARGVWLAVRHRQLRCSPLRRLALYESRNGDGKASSVNMDSRVRGNDDWRS